MPTKHEGTEVSRGIQGGPLLLHAPLLITQNFCVKVKATILQRVSISRAFAQRTANIFMRSESSNTQEDLKRARVRERGEEIDTNSNLQSTTNQ